MNSVILIGRLVAEPELRHTQNQTAVCTYRLAVDRQTEDKQADFISCICWRKTAEFASKYLHKGMKIAIQGQIRTDSYEDKDGKKIYKTEVLVDRHEFCESKKADNDNHITHTSGAYEDAYVELTDDFGELPF